MGIRRNILSNGKFNTTNAVGLLYRILIIQVSELYHMTLELALTFNVTVSLNDNSIM